MVHKIIRANKITERGKEKEETIAMTLAMMKNKMMINIIIKTEFKRVDSYEWSDMRIDKA